MYSTGPGPGPGPGTGTSQVRVRVQVWVQVQVHTEYCTVLRTAEPSAKLGGVCFPHSPGPSSDLLCSGLPFFTEPFLHHHRHRHPFVHSSIVTVGRMTSAFGGLLVE